MGRSVPVMPGARGASQMASRSYVFGRDDSAGPTDGSNAQVQLLSCYCCCCCHTFRLLSERPDRKSETASTHTLTETKTLCALLYDCIL